LETQFPAYPVLGNQLPRWSAPPASILGLEALQDSEAV
jgi:hypothetical protein